MILDIKYEIPTRTISSSNIREHWAVRARRARQQRELAAICTTEAMRKQYKSFSIFKGMEITITRYGKRKLDGDNLAISAKHCRDGIADALAVNDGDERINWIYKQEKSKQYYLTVEIKVY